MYMCADSGFSSNMLFTPASYSFHVMHCSAAALSGQSAIELCIPVDSFFFQEDTKP